MTHPFARGAADTYLYFAGISGDWEDLADPQVGDWRMFQRSRTCCGFHGTAGAVLVPPQLWSVGLATPPPSAPTKSFIFLLREDVAPSRSSCVGFHVWSVYGWFQRGELVFVLLLFSSCMDVIPRVPCLTLRKCG